MSKPAVLLVLLLPAALPVPAAAAGPRAAVAGRWLPSECSTAPDSSLPTKNGETAEERWNRAYRIGYAAIEKRDLDTAEESFCEALVAAQGFSRNDVRWAETFDELGLLSYLRGDQDRAEALQGAATAEILLALGPEASDLSPAEKERCSVSLHTFLSRLAIVFERQGRAAEMQELERAPYRILGMGYVPASAVLARLDWLISRYLLAEDMKAADWLSQLRRQLQEDSLER
jgi:hypothetical protein